MNEPSREYEKIDHDCLLVEMIIMLLHQIRGKKLQVKIDF